MKVGYPDTINSAAAASPVKARYASSGEGVGDLKAVKLEKGAFAKKQDPPIDYNDTPINMITPLKAREMSAKRIARRGKRVERIDAKANSIAEQAYLKGVADEDLPTTAKKKYDRLTKKADRISAKTTKKSPVKNIDPLIAKNREARKAAAEKAKKAEDAIRQSQSSSENTTEPTRKKTKIGIAIQARKERRAENIQARKERRAERNPKVAERQKGRAERKELDKKIKTEKARVTNARQERKTSKTTDRLDKVKKKVDTKVTKIKKKK